ncbi:hypothetical protein GCM10010166_64320 [Couchioplanes caeruleus subsp. azureus]|nr:hypothetical protein GCM10010166_64320 [Couchioplanes caeruleus subsp. azureus]
MPVLPVAAVAAAVVAVLGWPQRTAPVVAAAGTASLAGTAAHLLLRPVEPRLPVPLALVEVVALLALVAVAARRLPPRRAAVAALPAVAGVGSWVLRVGAPMSALTLTGCAVWAMVGLGAGAVGGYLRLLEVQRRRAVLAERRDQRLYLAGELHDFVAHDVSGILALAQAAQLLPAGEADRVTRILQAIEQAGHRALASMDRTVRLLHDSEPGPGSTLDDVPDLVARFSAAQEVTMRVDVAADVPREISGTAYRVIVEALTNIRRHAPRATRVDLAVRTSGDLVTVEVRDDGGAAPAILPARQGGLGIAGLTERVRLLGGMVEAGPCAPAGWCLRATLPLAGTRPAVPS